MSRLTQIMKQVDTEVSKQYKIELRKQGHHNTGALEASFTSEITENNMDVHVVGKAFSYANILNEGVRKDRASFKQFYFVKEFFLTKGYEKEDAAKYAAMTIHRWMKGGMSTAASSRFSETGERNKFIQAVEKRISSKMDEMVHNGVDKVINTEINKQKSETI